MTALWQDRVVDDRSRADARPDERRVTVAIVTYRSKTELPDCIESLLASDIPVKIVVIDNDSNDGTLELAQQFADRHPSVVAVRSERNLGLAAGNNLVRPYVTGEFILMLNPDTVVRKDTVSAMVAIMDADPGVGVVGPTNVYGDGQRFSSYQRSWNLWHVFLWRVLPYSLTRALYDKWSRYEESEVFYVSGSCLLIRSSVFAAVGGYDPVFFLTIEDVCDLCRRVRDRGYRVVFTPRTEVVHYCSRSGEQVPALSLMCGYEGSIHYFRKYNGRAGAASAYLLVVFGCAGKVLMSLLKVLLRRREIDRRHLRVYCQIFPRLLRVGSRIVFGERHGYAK